MTGNNRFYCDKRYPANADFCVHPRSSAPYFYCIKAAALLLLFFALVLVSCTAPPAPASAPVTVIVVVTATPAPALPPSATPTPAPTLPPSATPAPAMPEQVSDQQLDIRQENILVWTAEDGREVVLDAGAAGEKLRDVDSYAGGTRLLLLYAAEGMGVRYHLLDLAAGQSFDLYQGQSYLPAFAFSPDGGQFASITVSTSDGSALDVLVRPVQPGAQPMRVGGALRQPFADLPYDGYLHWLSDGQSLLWSDERGLWAWPAGGGARLVSEQAAYALNNPSPEGRYIFLVTSAAGEPGCYVKHVLDMQTLQAHEIPGAKACGDQAQGDLELSVYWGEAGGVHVRQVSQAVTTWRPVDRGGGRAWVDGGPAMQALPHPASDDLALVDGALVQRNPQTGEESTLVAQQGGPFDLVKFAASPDLRWLALVYGDAHDPSGPYRLDLLDRQAGEETILHEGRMSSNFGIIDLAFSPDGQWLAYIPVDEKPAALAGRRGLSSPLAGASAYFSVYLLQTGQPQKQARAGDWMAGVAYAGDGRSTIKCAPDDAPYKLLAWGEPGPFLLWANCLSFSLSRVEARKPDAVQTVLGGDAWADAVQLGAVSPDGRYLVARLQLEFSSSNDVQIIDLQQGETFAPPPEPEQGNEADFFTLPQPLPSWLPDGRLLLTRTTTTAHVYRIDPDNAEFFIEEP